MTSNIDNQSNTAALRAAAHALAQDAIAAETQGKAASGRVTDALRANYQPEFLHMFASFYAKQKQAKSSADVKALHGLMRNAAPAAAGAPGESDGTQIVYVPSWKQRKTLTGKALECSIVVLAPKSADERSDAEKAADKVIAAVRALAALCIDAYDAQNLRTFVAAAKSIEAINASDTASRELAEIAEQVSGLLDSLNSGE